MTEHRKVGVRERLLSVIVTTGSIDEWSPEDQAGEMEELISACGGVVKDAVFASVDKLSSSHLIGRGKVNEIFVRVAAGDIDAVVFNFDLKGTQQRNLEEDLKIKVLDRTQLILDIFARHARSLEGKMQVELAQLEYALPRLVGRGRQMSRLGGGIGTLGPGETQLETDRRKINTRIAQLKKRLKDVESNRAVNRKKRKDRAIPVIALVGYTNAGKTTLLNALTDAGQQTHDGLFTTLDSVSRQLVLPNHQAAILSDTVGFIHQLPHNLIQAFHATLEEVVEADILMHVVDVSHPKFRNFYDAVNEVLSGLEVMDKPTITVLNKIDRVTDRSWFATVYGGIANPVVISAGTGENLDVLRHKILEDLHEMVCEIHVDVPITRMDLVHLAHEQGDVYSVKYYNDRINLRASVPKRLVGVFEKGAVP